MFELLWLLFTTVLAWARPRQDLVLENLLVRHQLAVLTRPTRSRPRARLRLWDKVRWILARRWCVGWREHLTFVTPDTVVRWHRKGWRLFWRWKSRSRGGRPHLSPEVRELIATISRDNRLWGTERIRRELLKVTLTPPAGMTTRRQFASGDPLTLADKALGAAGPTGVQTASVSKSPGFWTGQAVVLRPGSGSPPPTSTPTPTPTSIGTPSPTQTWTSTPVPSPTLTATSTSTPTPTPTSTATPTLTPSPTPTPASTGGITFRASSATDVSGKTLTIPQPTGVVQNDVMVAAIYWDNSRQPTITAPSGWTVIRRDGSTTNEEVALYYRVATAAEPVSYTWTASRSISFAGIIAAYTGANTTNPIDAHAGQTGSTASPVAPSVTAVGINDLLITVWSTWNNNVTITPPAGMTSRAQFTASDPVDLADATLAGAGATGTQSATTSTSPGFWTDQSVALRAGP